MIVVLALAVPGAIMLLTQAFAWEGGYFQWYYVLPIAVLVPWLPILRARAEHLGHRVLLTDAIVCLLAGARIFSPAVPMSGHALFISYTFLTIPNRWYRLASGAAFLHAAWLKAFAWNEAGSFVGGGLVGAALAALTVRLWLRQSD
jgi:hypothetical protein